MMVIILYDNIMLKTIQICEKENFKLILEYAYEAGYL